MDDKEIVDLFWARSEQAISAATAKYSKYCQAIAYNILRNNEDAEECVNDTYARAWNAIPPARPEQLSTFLGKIVRHLSFDRYKRNHAEKRGCGEMVITLSELEDCVPDTAGTAESLIDGEAITAALDAFLAMLKPTVRKVFMRRYWYSDSLEEIAGNYGMTVGKVKSILFRAREQLKSNLLKEGIIL
ncbi:MAG: sigma-70 family RNA polymerase sigma factor [Clostridiales Family XIII bacterium]|jgi:RNA polymerase sigma-70 factor (ECF subfamily)|nr:sigma-70 family RNA polymerase sigma factor [Clostridiales Family XIII bacterium]